VRGLFLQFDVLTLLGAISVIWTSQSILMITTDLFSQSSRDRLLVNNLKEIVKLLSNVRELIFLAPLFFYILLMNSFGLAPYTFPATAHVSLTLGIGLSSWWAFILLGILFNLVGIISHLLPNNTPLLLIRFIRLVERVRIIIRPITLRVRLAANITAGHLILTLIASSPTLIANYGGQVLLFVLEGIVAIIQRYVFIILLYLYLQDRLK